ncbi:MAG TPA: nucleotide disphospho-sugar-binding domain-containing protein, partial [Pirellulaceae bacterium]
PLPSELERFLGEGRPPVVVTPGSANRFGESFFATALEAHERLGIRTILVSRFREHVPHPLPRQSRHIEFASFAQLLPRTAAIVHHGGIGTVAQALAAGIPQVIHPLSHDQPDNGSRVARLGAGAMLEGRAFNSTRLAQTLADLLHGTAVPARCREISQRLVQVDPFTETCEEIERMGG